MLRLLDMVVISVCMLVSAADMSRGIRLAETMRRHASTSFWWSLRVGDHSCFGRQQVCSAANIADVISWSRESISMKSNALKTCWLARVAILSTIFLSKHCFPKCLRYLSRVGRSLLWICRWGCEGAARSSLPPKMWVLSKSQKSARWSLLMTGPWLKGRIPHLRTEGTKSEEQRMWSIFVFPRL